MLAFDFVEIDFVVPPQIKERPPVEVERRNDHVASEEIPRCFRFRIGRTWIPSMPLRPRSPPAPATASDPADLLPALPTPFQLFHVAYQGLSWEGAPTGTSAISSTLVCQITEI
jgi:hypothetical protein